MGLDLSKSSGQVTYLEEIVKELSEEFEIDEKEMAEICSLSLDYVKELTKDKETIAILLPYLGVLHFNRGLGRYYRKLYSRSNRESLHIEANNLEHRLEKVNKIGNKKLRKRPFLYKFKRILEKKGYSLPRAGVTLGQKEFWTTVSQMQNEINNK